MLAPVMREPETLKASSWRTSVGLAGAGTAPGEAVLLASQATSREREGRREGNRTFRGIGFGRGLLAAVAPPTAKFRLVRAEGGRVAEELRPP